MVGPRWIFEFELCQSCHGINKEQREWIFAITSFSFLFGPSINKLKCSNFELIITLMCVDAVNLDRKCNGFNLIHREISCN